MLRDEASHVLPVVAAVRHARPFLVDVLGGLLLAAAVRGAEHEHEIVRSEDVEAYTELPVVMSLLAITRIPSATANLDAVVIASWHLKETSVRSAHGRVSRCRGGLQRVTWPSRKDKSVNGG